MPPDNNINIIVDEKIRFLTEPSLENLKNWPNVITISVQLSITDL